MQAQQRSNSSAEQASRAPVVSLSGAMLAGAALFCVLGATYAQAQIQPSRVPGGFQRPGPNTQTDPDELSAYQAAISQQNPGDRVASLQQFLSTYPNSNMRQPAIGALMAAQRQMQTGQSAPEMLNHTPPPSPIPSAPAYTPGPAAAPVAKPAGPQRDSLLQQAPKQAKITVAPHNLEIRADNSTLSQILREIAGTTGMKIEGLSKDERIFGTYGPGDAREVLLALLEGSGYNVVMIGDLATGAPRELNLTQRGAAGAAGSSPTARSTSEEDADDDQDVQQAPPQPEPLQAQPPQNAPNGQDPAQQQQRTPQEILQELQRLRQQNQNQPAPQSPQ